MKLIVGLGNPELKYFFTRHNIGFGVIDVLCDKLGGIKLDDTKFNGAFCKTKYNGEDVIIAKPLTYMNLSGDFIAPLANFYKIDKKDIIVIHDELALNLGRIKISYSSSSAGHNGIESIIEKLGSKDFIRVRVGIGPIPPKINQIDFVLMKYTKDEMEEVNKILENAASATLKIIDLGLEKAMNDVNTKVK